MRYKKISFQLSWTGPRLKYSSLGMTKKWRNRKPERQYFFLECRIYFHQSKKRNIQIWCKEFFSLGVWRYIIIMYSNNLSQRKFSLLYKGSLQIWVDHWGGCCGITKFERRLSGCNLSELLSAPVSDKRRGESEGWSQFFSYFLPRLELTGLTAPPGSYWRSGY